MFIKKFVSLKLIFCYKLNLYGLLPAMDELLPDVEQIFCVRHLYNNFRKKFPGKKLKELMWRAAKATFKNAFDDAMKEIKDISQGAYDYLKLIPAKHWSKSMFSGMYIGFRCNNF